VKVGMVTTLGEVPCGPTPCSALSFTSAEIGTPPRPDVVTVAPIPMGLPVGTGLTNWGTRGILLSVVLGGTRSVTVVAEVLVTPELEVTEAAVTTS